MRSDYIVADDDYKGLSAGDSKSTQIAERCRPTPEVVTSWQRGRDGASAASVPGTPNRRGNRPPACDPREPGRRKEAWQTSTPLSQLPPPSASWWSQDHRRRLSQVHLSIVMIAVDFWRDDWLGSDAIVSPLLPVSCQSDALCHTLTCSSSIWRQSIFTFPSILVFCVDASSRDSDTKSFGSYYHSNMTKVFHLALLYCRCILSQSFGLRRTRVGDCQAGHCHAF